MTDEDPDTTTAEVLFESRPSVRPTALLVVVIVLVAAVLVGVLFASGDALGGNASTLAGVVVALGALLVLRYLGRIYVLLNTEYVVTPTEIRREFSLFLIRSSREVPVHQLRGMRFSQSAVQRLLGYGSVSFLTAGPNRSLGFLAFDNVPDAAARRDQIRDLVRECGGSAHSVDGQERTKHQPAATAVEGSASSPD